METLPAIFTGTLTAPVAAFAGLVEPVPTPVGVTLSGGGYGDWKFDHTAIRDRARRLAADLPQLMAAVDVDFVAVRGTSGTFIAGAIQAMCDIPVMLLRKSGEASHGCDVEGNYTRRYRRGLILDDFVGSGATVKGMVEDLRARFGAQAAFVGVVEHNGSSDIHNHLSHAAVDSRHEWCRDEYGRKEGYCGLPIYSFIRT